MSNPISPTPTVRANINRPVFFASAILIGLFSFFGAAFTDTARDLFTSIQAKIVQDFGWFYILAGAIFLGFALFLMVSRYGDIRLGPDDSEPDYNYVSWFAMLFSAGMGIGILFFGVAEPIQHYTSPPTGIGRTTEAARHAMTLTFFHWGLHAWAIYIVVGLSLAYFSFRRGLPLTIRSSLYPLFGRRINGPLGHAVDTFAVIGTMFGLATSLGLGVLQINAGLTHLFGIENDIPTQVVLIAIITAIATASVVSGLDRGVRRLSELNIILAIMLLVFVLATGSTVFLLQAFVQNIGSYLGELVPRTFSMYAYEPNPWLGNWTLFYWGWWIAWSPFVGMFIARISRGRTIREFVAGVMMVPVLFTFLWMTVFGNTALSIDIQGLAPLGDIVENNLPLALFATLEQLPWPTISAGLAVLLIVSFFVTSADSGAMVIDMITAGKGKFTPVWQRVFWAVASGLVAAILLVTGGLNALQTAAIASALPFAVIMLLMCYGLLRALQTESVAGRMLPIDANEETPPTLTWEQRLDSIVRHHTRAELSEFLGQVAAPAMQAVATQIQSGEGLTAELTTTDESMSMTVSHGDRGVFSYSMRIRPYKVPSFAWMPSSDFAEAKRLHYRLMARSTDSDGAHDVTGFTETQLINDFLARYARFRNARRAG